MIYEFKLPDIGEGVVEGEVVRWLVAEGDPVKEDQPLVEVMTDKATVEIPAPRAGRVARRMYEEGQVCPVGRVLVTIETDVSDNDSGDRPSGETDRSGETDKVGAFGLNPGPADARSVLATPATRKLARTLGVDIRQVTGKGRGGRITSDDVRAHDPMNASVEASAKSREVEGDGDLGDGDGDDQAEHNRRARATRAATGGLIAAPPRADVRVPFRGVRRKIAEHLVHSKHTAAHFTYVEEVDVSDLVGLREKANERLASRGIKLSFLPFFIKATVAALDRFPQLNASLDETVGEIVRYAARHIGLATATDHGLLVPVIRDAGQKSLVDLAHEIARLAEATRLGKATRQELSGSTFTITSLGMLGGVLATPIINFPEAAILGIHKIAKRPMADGKRVVVRDMMNLSISVDHRIVDGYEAAQFVNEIKTTLENPGLMFLDSI